MWQFGPNTSNKSSKVIQSQENNGGVSGIINMVSTWLTINYRGASVAILVWVASMVMLMGVPMLHSLFTIIFAL